MEGVYSRLPLKRPHMESENNGQVKKRVQVDSDGETVFRLLCPEVKAGSVIGKGGTIISQIRQETGARINIQETVQGCEERVILISAPENQGRFGSADMASPAQEALYRVYRRICDDVDVRDSNAVVTIRLILQNSQVGCLMGKGGKIMQEMRNQSKAQIRVLPREQNPPCAEPTDEVLQIVGNLNVVSTALGIVSMRLRNSSLKESAQLHPHSPVYSLDYNAAPPDGFSQYQNSVHHYKDMDGVFPGLRSSVDLSRGPSSATGPPKPTYVLPEGGRTHPNDGPSTIGEEIVFRVLCPNNKIGSVIGKGGSIIRRLRDEIGVKIKVTDAVPGSDDRIIIVASHEGPADEDLSPAQEALLHIQSQTVDLGPDKDSVITTRLLVPANQVGCLLGKGGSIISEMRRKSGANIRILPRKDLPSCALETDELVQIVGDIRVSREALVEITRRLRSNFHADKPLSGSGPLSFGNLVSMSSRGRLEPLSPGRSYVSSSSKVFQDVRSSSYSTLPHSPGSWSSKKMHDTGAMNNPTNFEEPIVRAVGSSLFGRSSAGLVTKTTVEVVVPGHAIAALLGKSGNGISQIQKISGAKIRLIDVRPGSSAVVEISGTPEQTHAAQCLIQATIINNKSLFG